MSRLAVLLPMLVLLVPAACAPKQVDWVKPGGDEDRAQTIEAECRSLARSKVERDYRLDELTQRDREIAGDSVLRRNLGRYDARQEIQRLFANCMREHGYRPVEREESK